MDYKKDILDSGIRCYNIIKDKHDRRFGLECNRLLMRRNSDGKAAGEIKCPICGALYDIKDDKIFLIKNKR